MLLGALNSKDFSGSWEEYLKITNSMPVPYAWFNKVKTGLFPDKISKCCKVHVFQV